MQTKNWMSALTAMLGFVLTCGVVTQSSRAYAQEAPAQEAEAASVPLTSSSETDPTPVLESIDPDSDLSAPSGCWAERSCGARKFVCKRIDEPRPCGAAGCTDMQFACTDDAACAEGYSCRKCAAGSPAPCPWIGGICRPRSCLLDRDCRSANVVCQAGACTHKTCTTSRSCRGYCVRGACWNKAGWCHDTSLPPPPSPPPPPPRPVH